MSVQITETISKGLEKFAKDEARKAEIGLLFASEHVYEIADPITPLDSSTLKNSKITPFIDKGLGYRTAYIGYSAKYAAWVHEMPDTTNFKKALATNK